MSAEQLEALFGERYPLVLAFLALSGFLILLAGAKAPRARGRLRQAGMGGVWHAPRPGNCPFLAPTITYMVAAAISPAGWAATMISRCCCWPGGHCRGLAHDTRRGGCLISQAAGQCSRLVYNFRHAQLATPPPSPAIRPRPVSRAGIARVVGAGGLCPALPRRRHRSGQCPEPVRDAARSAAVQRLARITARPRRKTATTLAPGHVRTPDDTDFQDRIGLSP